MGSPNQHGASAAHRCLFGSDHIGQRCRSLRRLAWPAQPQRAGVHRANISRTLCAARRPRPGIRARCGGLERRLRFPCIGHTGPRFCPQKTLPPQIPGFDPTKRPNQHGCWTSPRFSIRPEGPLGRFENRHLCPCHRHLDAWTLRNSPRGVVFGREIGLPRFLESGPLVSFGIVKSGNVDCLGDDAEW